jgi:hypothetical protein
MKPINWSDLIDNYKGLWVALEQDEKTVVSSGKNAKRVFREAKDKGVEMPTLVKVPTKSLLYVG